MTFELSASEGRIASEVWSETQYRCLLEHLHGSNSPRRFIAGFVGQEREAEHPVPLYRRNRKHLIGGAITSTWKTICAPSDRPYAVVLLADTIAKQSPWVVWDFDFHVHPEDAFGADMLRNLRAFVTHASKLDADGICYIVESSGRGWHFWLVSRQAISKRTWHQIRDRIESLARFSGKPEFLPGFEGDGKGCRAPGSANINTWHTTREDWQTNRIFFENTSVLRLELKRPKEAPLFSSSGSPPHPPSQDGSTCGLRAARADAEDDTAGLMGLLRRHRIRAASTRHTMLSKLVGEGCFHFGREILREAAVTMWEQAVPKPKTTLEEHMEDFEELYNGALHELVFVRWSEQERVAYHRLGSNGAREVFVIVQNYARHGGGWCFVSTKRVGSNIGHTPGSISLIRRQFEQSGIIKRLPGGYSPGKRAYSYRWLLPMLPTATG